MRTAQDPLAAAAALSATAAGFDSALPVYDLKTLEAMAALRYE